MIKLTSTIFDLAQKVAPRSKADWMTGMRAEGEFITPGLTRLVFALGCLKSAIICRVRNKHSLHLIGQGLIGAGLTALCLGGFIMMSDVADKAAANVLTVLLSFYAIGIYFALADLNKLKRFAGISGMGFLLSWLLISVGNLEFAGVSSDVLAALSAEAALLMTALFVASTYVLLIGEIDEQDTGHV